MEIDVAGKDKGPRNPEPFRFVLIHILPRRACVRGNARALLSSGAWRLLHTHHLFSPECRRRTVSFALARCVPDSWGPARGCPAGCLRPARSAYRTEEATDVSAAPGMQAIDPRPRDACNPA